MRVHSSYLTIAFENHSAIVEFTVAALRQIDFDIIAYRGESGALVAPAVAYILKKKLVCVRKNPRTSHSSHDVEGWQGEAKYVIIDDLVNTCHTVREILEQIRKTDDRMKCVGLYLYRDDGTTFASSSAKSELEKLGVRVIRGPLDPALDDYAYNKFREELALERIAATSKKCHLVPIDTQIKPFDSQIKFVIPRDDKDDAVRAALQGMDFSKLDRRLGKQINFAKAYGATTLSITKALYDRYVLPVNLCLRANIWYSRGWITRENVEALAALPPETQLKLCNELWQAILQQNKTNGSPESWAADDLDSMLKSALTTVEPTPIPSYWKHPIIGKESSPNATQRSVPHDVLKAISYVEKQSSPTSG